MYTACEGVEEAAQRSRAIFDHPLPSHICRHLYLDLDTDCQILDPTNQQPGTR
jgi:hypothetical protein